MKTGVLLVNLGSPASYSSHDVKKYLKEFLLDPRVLDLPFILREWLVRFKIIPNRYKQTIEQYKRIWLETGSPLIHTSQEVQIALQHALGDDFIVAMAMRYQPYGEVFSIEAGLAFLQQAHVAKIVVLPLFPQYASATSGSILEQVYSCVMHSYAIPHLHTISHFHRHPAFIEAWTVRGNQYPLSDYDHILFSFHGLPERHLAKIENETLCYRTQCMQTAEAIADALKIPPHKYTITFQSRLGKEPWLGPSTPDVTLKLAGRGVKKILVFSPSFVADCLETLYEIGIELEEQFINARGERLELVRSLNSHPQWIQALKNIIINYDQLV